MFMLLRDLVSMPTYTEAAIGQLSKHIYQSHPGQNHIGIYTELGQMNNISRAVWGG